MFKKILMIMGISVSLLSLIACGGDNDSYNDSAFELFERSQEAMADIDSFIIALDLVTEGSVAGVSEETEMSLQMSLEMLSDTEARMSASGTVMGIEVDFYFRDGYMYMDLLGERNREAMDFEEAFEMTGGSLVESTLEEEWIESSSVESLEDGGYRLNFTLDPVGMLGPSFGDNIAGIPFSEDMIDGGTVEMVFYIGADYHITHAEVEMNVTFIILGETMSMDISVDATYIQLGDVSVEFPAWLDEFDAS